jgi:hypothetical protein
MTDRFNQMPTFRAVTAFCMWRFARHEVPLDSIAFPTGAKLAARLYDRPPVQA